MVLLSITVNAQNFWKTLIENNSFNQVAIAMAEKSFETATAHDNAAENTMWMAEYLEEEQEAAMQLENWMTDNIHFNAFFAIEEKENALQLENWMTDAAFFCFFSGLMNTETEQPLEVEDWMLEENFFTAARYFENEQDKTMAVE